MTEFFPGTKGAVFSPCGEFRYALWRIWSRSQKPLMVVGLNPSTADASKDDPTIRRCIGYAARWGMGGLLMGNLFAFRSTYPVNLISAINPIGDDNDLWLARMGDEAEIVLAAWGQNVAKIDPSRVNSVRAMFPTLHHLALTAAGQPKHPLYLPGELKPTVWEIAA